MSDEVASIGIRVDTDGVDRGIQRLDDLARRGPQVEASMSGIATESRRVARSLADLGAGAGDGLRKTAEASQQAATGIRASGNATKEATTHTEGLRKAITGLSADEERFVRTLVDQTKALTMLNGEFASYTAAQRSMSAGVQEMARALAAKNEALRSERDALAQSERAHIGLSGAMTMVTRGLAMIGVSVTVGEFIKMADASTNVASKLKLVTSSTVELASVQGDLFRSAQSSRVNYVELVSTYAQMARATKELGVSQKDMLAVTQTISQAVTISGGSAQSAQAALVQLSQGFASGALRGEELNSVMEQTPRLAMAIAQGMGISLGELRKFGSEGKLSAEAVIDALKKAAPSVQNEFGQMTVTVESATTNAINSLTRLSGAFDSATGATGMLAGGMQYLSSTMDEASNEMDRLAKAKSASDLLLLVADTSDTMGKKLSNAQAELARLNGKLAEKPNDFFLKSAITRTQSLISSLTEAKGRMDALEGAGVDPTGRTGTRTRSDSFAAHDDAVRKSEMALAEVRAKSAGINKEYFETLKTLMEAKKLGTLTDQAYIDTVSDLAKRTWDASAAGKDAAKSKRDSAKASNEAEAAVNRELAVYQALLSTANQQIAQNKVLISGAKNVTESRKLEIKLEEDLAAGKLKLGSAHEAELRARIAILAAQERSIAATKREVEAYREQIANQATIATDLVAQSKAREAGALALDAYYREVKEGARALQLEASLIGKSNVERATAVGQYQALIKYERELQRIRDNTGYDEGDREKARADALAAYTIDTANAANKAVIDEWNNTVNQVESIFVSGFADMMNNGKGGWDSFCRSLKTSFYTLVAKEVYAAFAKPFVVQIVGNLMGLTGSGGLMNMLGSGSSSSGDMNLGNIFSMGRSLYSMFTGSDGLLSSLGSFLGFGSAAASGLGMTARG